ncbi:MAG: hypothetical protein IJR81_01050 [Clostridia bacterium]|nr:hypothetical protein [Clostridia bacterium]
MKQVLPLIRIQLMEFFPFSAVKNTNDAAAKKRARRRLTSTLVIFLACVYMSGTYSMGMLKGGLDSSTYLLVPALMLMAGSVLGAVTTLTKAGTVLFSASSLDPLLSLPLSRRTVVLSRVFSLYFEEFLIQAGMLLTAGVCCQIVIGSLPAAFWPVLVLTVFLAPLIPLGVGGLIGLFVNMLTARMKNKSLFTTVFSMLFLLAVMFLSFNAGTLFTDMADIAGSLQTRIFSLYPPARLFVEGLAGNLGSFLLYAAISLILLALLCLAAVRGFAFFYGAINATASSKAFRMGRQKRSGLLLTLCKKELRQKYNTPIWAMNTDMGTLMAVILTVALIVAGKAPVVEVLDQVFGRGQQAGLLFGLIIASAQCLSLSASAAVSMEGKGLWLIKSLPIQADTWLRSKLLVSMLPPALGGLVCGVALTVGWQLPVWNVFVIMGLSLLVAWAFSVVELAIGLHFARFDWENPAEVVKQGGGVMLSMLVTLVFLGGGVALFIFLGPLGAAVLCALLLLVALPVRLLLRKNAEKNLTNL